MSLLTPPRGRQPLYRVNPVAKLGALVPLSAAVLLTLDWVSASVALAGTVLVLLVAGLRGRQLWLRTVPVWLAAPLAGLSMILYGRPSGATFFQLGFVHVTEGSLAIGLATSLRVLAIALPAVLLLATMDPTDLADALAQVLHLPSRFVLGALAGLRLVGLFVRDWRALELARRARGVADSGRFRRLLGQALALLVLAVRRGGRLATAMEARGFDGASARSWARPSVFGRAEWLTVGCGVLLALTCTGAALAAGTWSFALS